MAEHTVNEDLRDLSIRHQVQLHRLASGTSAEVAALLKAVEGDIVAQIAKYDPAEEGGYNKARLRSMLAAIKEINNSSYTEASDYLQGHLEELARYESGYQAAQIEKTVPFDWPLAQPSEVALDKLVNSEPFAGRLLREWASGLAAGQLDRITVAMRIGVVEGEAVDKLAKRIRGTKALNFKDGIMEIGRRQAENVVRTATSHVANEARVAVYKANRDLVGKVQFTATLDLRTTPFCMAHDGLVYDIDESMPELPHHINCRSVYIPVVKSWRELGIKADEAEGTRASVNGQVADKVTYPEWLKSRPRAEVEDALGVTRAKLFLDGDLDIDRFIDEAGESYTLDELRRRDAKAFAKAGL